MRENTTTYGTTEGTQFPVEDTNHAILRWVEDNVVQLVVTVDDSRAGLRLIWEVLGVPIHKVVESGYLPDGCLAFDIHHLGLCE
jgi:hypothetical protein